MQGEGKQNVHLMKINRNILRNNKVWEEIFPTRSESNRERRVI